MDIRNGDETFQMPEDFKGHLNGQLGLDREEGIPATPPGQRDRSIHNHLGIGGSGNLGIASQIDGMGRPPQQAFTLGTGLQKNKIAAPSEVGGHPNQNLPVESFLIEANASPVLHILEDLVGDGIDTRLCFTGAGPTGDEPSPDKIFHRPRKTSQTNHDIPGMGLTKEAPSSEECG